MSIRAFFNSVKEGFKGISRHPIVTIASLTTILLMLLIMSIFFIFSINARSIMRRISQLPPIEVYMKLQSTEEEVAFVENVIINDERIIEYNLNTPIDNYNNFKSNLGSSSSILDEFDYNMYLPYTFNIRLLDPEAANDVCNMLSTIPGVSKVNSESNVMSFLIRTNKIVNYATVISFATLLLISLFIISNMVRISVFSRASEIEIMKFVGATNFYIRLPFVIEGAIVGLMSAILSWGITTICYQQVYYRAMSSIDINSFYALLQTSKVTWWVLLICVLMGCLIGGVGSGLSVRKYIRV